MEELARARDQQARLGGLGIGESEAGVEMAGGLAQGARHGVAGNGNGRRAAREQSGQALAVGKDAAFAQGVVGDGFVGHRREHLGNL